MGWPHTEPVTSAGVRLRCDTPVEAAGRLDTLIVTGADDLTRLPADTQARQLLTTLVSPRTRVASVCTGAFVLARAGLLDGHQATTHWRYASALATQFPQVDVRPDAIFIRSGRFVSSAGVTAGIDLTLALVEEDHGPDLAREVARELVVFLRRPGGQSQFSVRTELPPVQDQRLRQVIDLVAAAPAEEHTAQSLARAATMTPRHLRRLFRDQLGTTPGHYLERVRLEAARALLEAGTTVTSAARASGFGSDESLRRAFHATHNVSPSTYQHRFRTTR
ncbi:GlxA family transcriptional regulator [Fodinicola feengrottensis]|uniref:GlxA family transcriptional regulator n=1 Tax=Fodinicola feengrottensis TaxID=435914 RepID=UPI002440F7E6|nr:helix-turn-helix domain-containing protein [Fodinicola feengrottensis]